jgi:hypothetical protein
VIKRNRTAAASQGFYTCVNALRNRTVSDREALRLLPTVGNGQWLRAALIVPVSEKANFGESLHV